MPSNSGGLSLDLALYPSTPVGARLEFHRERYDRLVEPLEKGKSAFATEQPTSKHTYDRLSLTLTRTRNRILTLILTP